MTALVSMRIRIQLFIRILGSSVPDPWHFGTDPYPWIRTSDLRIQILHFSSVIFKTPTKNIFYFIFIYILLFEGTFTLFFEDKGHKKSRNSRNQGFSYYFCLMMEVSGAIPLTNGSGSGRPKIFRIRYSACQTSQSLSSGNFRWKIYLQS
jgi:hypothetical protein